MEGLGKTKGGGGILRSLLTTAGDLLVRGAAVPERLAAVAAGQVLKSAGIGVLPAWGKDKLSDIGFKIGAFSRSTSGNEVVTGVGFEPSFLFFIGYNMTAGQLNFSIGFDDNTTTRCFYQYDDGTLQSHSNLKSIYLQHAAGDKLMGLLSAVGADGFTVTFTLTGTLSSVINYLAVH